jgi:hypothetical protein
MNQFFRIAAAFYADKEEAKMARFRIRQRRGDLTRSLSDVEFIRLFRLDKHGFRLVCDDLRKHTMLKGTKLYPLEFKVRVFVIQCRYYNFSNIYNVSQRSLFYILCVINFRCFLH